jgi:hypothetical protein
MDRRGADPQYFGLLIPTETQCYQILGFSIFRRNLLALQ